jgi:two-component system nitrogen regulation sensor histidine kinase NtrY
MNRTTAISIFLTIVLCVTAVGVHRHFERRSMEESYASQLESYILDQEKDIRTLFLKRDRLQELLFFRDTTGMGVDYLRRQAFIEHLNGLPFNIAIFRGEQLLFWSDNTVLPRAAWGESLRQDTTFFHREANGEYLVFVSPADNWPDRKVWLCAILPIKHHFPIKRQYLQQKFPAPVKLPGNLLISAVPPGTPVHAGNTNPLFFLLQDDEQPSTLLAISVLLFTAAFISLGVALQQIARYLAQRFRLWMGTAFLIALFIGIRAFTLGLEAGAGIHQLPLFDIPVGIPFSPTLGDFLINVFILLWILFFMTRQVRPQPLNTAPHKVRMMYAGSTYLIIVLWVLFICGLIQQLVMNTPIAFNTPSLFDFSPQAWVAVISIILLMISIYLFSHHRMKDVLATELPLAQRLPLLALAALIGWPIQAVLLNLTLHPLLIIGLGLGILAAFETFEHERRQGFVWFMIWIAILSAIPALLLHQYVGQKDLIDKKEYVKELADLTDHDAEFALERISQVIGTDSAFMALMHQPDSTGFIDETRIQKALSKVIAAENYLHYNYTFNAFGFSYSGQPIFIRHRHVNRKRLDSGIKNRIQVTPMIYAGKDPLHRPMYVVDFGIQERDSSSSRLVLTFHRSRKERSDVYWELLIEKPFKGLPEDYAFGLFDAESKTLIDRSGGFSLSLKEMDIAPGTFLKIVKGSYTWLAYHSPGQAIAVIENPAWPVTKFFEFFCLFFGLFIVFVLLLAILNPLIEILPNTLNLSVNGKPSLRKRIQFAIFALTVAFFFTTAVVTIEYFRQSSAEYHQRRLDRKTQAILSDARHELDLLDVSSESPPESYSEMIDDLAVIHRIDINLYNKNGQLIRSSEDDFFKRGIQSRYMNPAAYHALYYLDAESYAAEEQIGKLQFRTSYFPLTVSGAEGEATLAYIALPFYSRDRDLQNDVTLFMDDLLYVYVSCVILAIIVSILIANSTTRGVVRISEKFRNFSLDSPNERLEARVDEELSELVRVYNQMSEELDRSARRLAQSERESAWREMAKQVAHEIKNPLTPMKLSIQYLTHALKNKPDNIEDMIARVSSTLMEQIENLSKIASEFSSFAKMPKAKNERLELNQLVTSCTELFEKNEKGVAISLSIPTEPVFVLADRHQLTSVLNNLLKNGQEAIQEGREGHLDVTLRKKEGKAIIRVRDNGAGIPQDIQQRVFQPNFTTKGSGTGLGLAICNNIIRNANGNIYFETGPNGTTFFVELPLIPEMPVLSR